MSSFRITIVELKPAAVVTATTPAVTVTDGPINEVKVFEQQFENLDVSRFARDINAKPRARRKSAKTAQA